MFTPCTLTYDNGNNNRLWWINSNVYMPFFPIIFHYYMYIFALSLIFNHTISCHFYNVASVRGFNSNITIFCICLVCTKYKCILSYLILSYLITQPGILRILLLIEQFVTEIFSPLGKVINDMKSTEYLKGAVAIKRENSSHHHIDGDNIWDGKYKEQKIYRFCTPKIQNLFTKKMKS